MQTMRAKDYLMQVAKLDRLISNKLVEIEQWKTRATNATGQSDGERVQASGSKQRMADAVCCYMQIEEEVKSQIDKLVAIRQGIIETIELLPSVEYDVLHKRYIQGIDFNEISIEMDRSYSWVTTIHGKALQHTQRILDERDRNKREDQANNDKKTD